MDIGTILRFIKNRPDMELIDKRVEFSLNDSGFTLPGDAVYTELIDEML